jgi:hypothetical protein
MSVGEGEYNGITGIRTESWGPEFRRTPGGVASDYLVLFINRKGFRFI